jgi:hypothetical protein
VLQLIPDSGSQASLLHPICLAMLLFVSVGGSPLIRVTIRRKRNEVTVERRKVH